MVLVDTSIWVDHLRATEETLLGLLENGRVLVHPFVLGELALGHLRQRETVLLTLRKMSQAMVVTDSEVVQFVGRNRLFGVGIGYVDAHLLVAVRLTLGASLWTRDKRLLAVADWLGLASEFAH
ncbi:MAG: type II toxin-antitoxin system VapC family toxin [Chloroflexia bacterium]|nr:type II toxin-antitoxin system VapC family toxin [Chloroflexia bacterium]